MTELLQTAANEMTSLSDMSGRLHDLIARQMGMAVAQDESIEEAQAIDLLVQHLDTIGAFLRLLSHEIPPELTVDFARMRDHLPLAALADRLGGSAACTGAGSDSGDLDLF